MNLGIERLYQIGNQPSRIIVGLMSGTSLDGLDIALCRFTGSGLNTVMELLNFKTVTYPAEFKEDLKSVFAKKLVDLQKLTLLNAFTGTYFGELVLQTLTEWAVDPADVDLIASHGQTIYHTPKAHHHLAGQPNATLQIADGDHIAVKTGIITVSDFRQKHVAAGGEGAPLAVYGDYLLFTKKGENRVMLNIGGIANFTYLPGDGDPSKVFSTDVGPGNTLMDQYVQKISPNQYYDQDAAIAVQGRVNQQLLEALLKNPFFDEGFPKTTGPELFNLAYLDDALLRSPDSQLSVNDVMATLCRFTTLGIIDAVKRLTAQNGTFVIYLSGGGMYNPLLVKWLKEGLSFAKFETTDALGINPDAKEAILFALLANEAISGSPIDFGSKNGTPSVTMGKVSFP